MGREADLVSDQRGLAGQPGDVPGGRPHGRELVVQRNVHSSVIDGMIMAGLKPTFAAPELDPDLGVAHCLTPDDLAEALDRCPDASAAVVVSPTYFGACADISGLAEVAHSRGVPLVADEAWGATSTFTLTCRPARDRDAAPTWSFPPPTRSLAA